MAEGILSRPSSFTPIGRPPICDWPEEARFRCLSHPMDPRTVPVCVPREDRELVTNAPCMRALTQGLTTPRGTGPSQLKQHRKRPCGRRHGPVRRDQPALSRVRLRCRHARRTDRSRRRLTYDADSRSAVRGARDDRCRDRPPLRGDNQDRRHADARTQRNGGLARHRPGSLPAASRQQS